MMQEQYNPTFKDVRAAGTAPYSVRQSVLCGRENIRQVMKQVFDFQTKAFGGEISTDWKVGTFYTGVYAAYEATGDSDFYNGARAWCESAGWKVSEILGGNFHADSICTAQTYLDIYMKEREPFMIADISANLEKYFSKETVTYKEMGHARWKDEERSFTGRNLWWWADSLYMAPPVLTRMYGATGDQRYLDLLHRFYWDSFDFLYREEDGLFCRDELYFDKKTPEGKPVYWGRGNGWVYAGLMRALPYIPDGDPQKKKYIRLFEDLTRSIVRYQQPDGLWRSSLNEPSWKPYPETSASSFFCYGLLAGINSGYLEAKTWLPVALRAWEGLLNCISPEGRLGFAQLVAEAPNFTRAQDSIDYTHGAFLLAASELYKMDLGEKGIARFSAPCEVETISRTGIWGAEYGEPIQADENFLHCGVIGSDGIPRVDLYSQNEVWSPFIYQQYHFPEADCAPALLKLSDGRLLAAYTRKGSPGRWYFKTAAYVASEFEVSWTLDWGAEQSVESSVGELRCNLLQLASEKGRIFNLFSHKGTLNVQFSDNLSEWGAPRSLVSVDGRLDFKWVSDGKGRIDILYSVLAGDEINLLHLGYRNGEWSGVGRLVHSSPASDYGLQADLQYDEAGNLLILFAAVSEEGKWTVFRAALSGEEKFAKEPIAIARTIGGVAMDSRNGEDTYISADSDPATGVPLQSGRCQIFRTVDGGWEQLTFDPLADNRQPVVPRRHGLSTCVAWIRGEGAADTGPRKEVVGILEK